MGDWIWIVGALAAIGAGTLVALGAAVLLDVRERSRRHAQRETIRRPPGPPVQLVREEPPLEEPRVLGRIGPAGRRT
jgi:hypothetical protein